MDVDVKVIAHNGLLFSPEVKVVLKNKYDPLNHSAENIECIVITD